MSILEVLKKYIPVEIIDGANVKETADMVDLDIAYKLLLVENPIQNKDDSLERFSSIPLVIEAKKRPSDGKYEIRFQTDDGPSFEILSVDETKVMRARFLLLKGFYVSNFDKLTLPKQNEVAAKYDIGFIPKI